MPRDNAREINGLSVALIFIGTIMGAGFASGREIWQFFGVFGEKGAIGLVIVCALFSSVGIATVIIARKLNTNHMGLVGNASKLLGIVFTVVLFFAIYGSATGNYYGFVTRLKDDKNKKKKIIVIAGTGFLLGLAGFKNVVAYMLPIEGFLGIGIILMIFANLVYVLKKAH